MARYSRPSRTLYVGDSLGVGTAPHLKGVKANVRGGRPSSEGLNIVRSKGRRFDRVVFDLGTNDSSVRDLKRSVRGVKKVADNVTMVTVNGPDAARKNKYLRRLASKGKIDLVDARGVQLSGDGIHATPTGYRQRAKLVSKALKGGTAPRKKYSKPTRKTASIAPSAPLPSTDSLSDTAAKSHDYLAELRKLRRS